MKEKFRDNSIDFLRTIAILLMVFAHANALLRIDSNPANEFFQNAGNIICFSLFVFCYGASLYYSKEDRKSTKLLRRIGLLYFAYLVVVALNIIENHITDGQTMLSYLSFVKLPGYGEFLVAFILFDVIYFLLKKPIDYISKDFALIVIISATLFGFSFFLLNQPYHNFLTNLLWGQKDLFSFPIFQYFIIFLLGMYYSKKRSENNLETQNLIVLTIVLASIYILSYFFNPSFGIDFYRWPPSLLFILNNLIFISVLILIFDLFRSFINKNNGLFEIPSSYAFHLFYIHIVILYLLRWSGVRGFILLSYALSLAITALPFFIRYVQIKTQKN